MKIFGKKMIALATAAVMVCAVPFTSQAAWIDGDTPSNYNNRVVDSYSNIYVPTVRTNFHAPTVSALIPVSSKADMDAASGAAASYYADAETFVYVGENVEYGSSAKTVLNTALTKVGGTNVDTITLNLFKYEGSVYKAVTSTTNNLKFMVSIPQSIRASSRDYAMIRINADGSYTYLTDLDTDAITLTFETNYFAANDLYCLVYAAHGAFDSYKPAAQTTASAATTATTTTTVTTQTTTTKTTTTTTTKK